jgi:hypothetical protein
VKTGAFAVKDVVRCLATRFDNGKEGGERGDHASRACLEGGERGDHVVFRHVPSGIHAVGWNNGFKKTFVCSAGSSNPGKEALHKRQRDDGSNLQRRVKCPDVISTHQEAAGAVDKHNSFRQGTLRLECFWETQLCQNRMFVCMMSACMVNAFLAWENELGRCDEPEQRDMAIGSRIIRFVVRVIDAILPSLQGECPGSADQTHHPYQLETIGRATTKTGSNPGRKHPIMNACSVCVAKKNRNGVGGKRARTTAHRYKVHKDILLCNASVGDCLAVHQAEHAVDI